MNYLQQSTALFGSLKNAVLGNPVTREYTIGQQVATFGPGLLWKVFEGKKKTTGQDVAVFIFEKSCVDQYDRKIRELIYEKMRHGPQQLTKLRHPRILTVQHPLEESRDSLAFATEPVFSSLSNVLGKHTNFTGGAPPFLKDFELYAVEKVYGLLQIAEGLTFIHGDANLNEGNLTTDNVIITKGGQWKLAGFHFSQSKLNPVSGSEYSTINPPCSRQDLNYLAPEWIFAQSSGYSFDICKTDMFSFGCLINAVYNHLKTPFDAGDSVPAYKKSTEQLSRLGSDYLQNVPLSVREHVQLLLNVSADTRPDAQATVSHPFFDDVAAMTLKYLDTLVQRDEITKSQFFKNLHHVLSKLPLRVLHQRILPPLFSEFPNHMMIPFVLPNVFAIAEISNKEDFNRLIFPDIKKILHVQKPVEVLLIFMQRMELLLKKCEKDDVKNFVLPLIFRALESPSYQIQELVLGIIPDFAHMIDYSSLKNAIVPRMKTIVTRSSSVGLCVNTLVCLGKIIEHLDKFLLVDEVFPALSQISSKDPAVLMSILGIYKQVMNQKKFSLEKDYLATRAIPYLLPLSVEPALNVKQFNNFMSVIRDMFDRVEQEHRTKLEQLQKMKDEQKSSLDFVKSATEDGSEKSGMNNLMQKVDEMVIGKSSMGTSSATPNTSDLFGMNTSTKQSSSKPFATSSQPTSSFSSPTSYTTSSYSSPTYTRQSTNHQSTLKPTTPMNHGINSMTNTLMSNNLKNLSSEKTGFLQSNSVQQNFSLNQQSQKQPVDLASFDSVLSPEMSNFKFRQQPVAMGTMLNTQASTLTNQQPASNYKSNYTPSNQSIGMMGNPHQQNFNVLQPLTSQSNQNSLSNFNQSFNNNIQANQNIFSNNQPMSNNQMMNSNIFQPINTMGSNHSNILQPMNNSTSSNLQNFSSTSNNISNQDINDLLL